jgi:hypothetical protein
MTCSLDELVADFAFALKAIDASRPIGSSKTRQYRPGVGPLTEAETVSKALEYLASVRSDVYSGAAPCKYPNSRQSCDCRMPGYWVIEFKLLRPFGDNAKEAEHWSENLLHPYPGNVSAIGDCLKLRESAFEEQKAVIVFGYEHTPPVIDLDVAVCSFEAIARNVVGLKIGNRASAMVCGLVHPCHQQAKVFGWEIIG